VHQTACKANAILCRLAKCPLWVTSGHETLSS
jgi:hypothetical protein